MARNLAAAAKSIRVSYDRYRQVLAERDAALLLGSGFASEIGDWLSTIALMTISFRLGEGALGVGGFLAVRMVPRLLFQGPAGTLGDRWPGRQLLLWTQLFLALIASSFALLTLYPSLWLLYLLVFLLETVSTVARPAFMVQLQAAAHPEWRSAANGLLFVGMTTAQFIGPLLGALLLAITGTAAVFLVNGLTFLCVAFAISRPRRPVTGEAGNAAASDGDDAAGGEGVLTIGYGGLLKRADLNLYTAISLSLSLLVQATIALFVVRAVVLGLGESGVGVFYAAVAAGSIVGSVVAGAGSHREQSTLFPVGLAMGLCAVSLALFGAASSIGVALIALTVAGFTTNFHEVAAISYFQHRLPASLFGRFFSLFLIALSAGGLIGALLGPTLERQIGVAGALLSLALPGVVLALIVVGVGLRSRSRFRPELRADREIE